MPTVNACYTPETNTITVPAGILQGRIYDPNASKEGNLGGIGTVIAHEISHDFDSNGSKYDADGNFNLYRFIAYKLWLNINVYFNKPAKQS